MNIRNLKKRILEQNFFRPSWYSVFINPYFINRFGLYKNIKSFADKTKSNAQILDVGCGLKPYQNLFNTNQYIGIDIESGGHSDEEKCVDKFYDGKNIPFENRSFDYVICTQVLEHAQSPEKVFEECARVLKPDGMIFFSMPFIYPEHEIPYDFQRYTKYKHLSLAKINNLKVISINKTTGFFGTFGQLFVVLFFEGLKFRSTIIKTILSIFLFAPIQIICLTLDFIFRKYGPTMDYVIIVKK